MLAAPPCFVVVSRTTVVPAAGDQLHGTPEQLVSKPGFGTRFVAACADGATPSTSAHPSTTRAPSSDGRTANHAMTTPPRSRRGGPYGGGRTDVKRSGRTHADGPVRG